eukprot:gb/GECG01010606.1/.p1 GENE.gb/GECG01010606.1/~~gb/GECG01010606.1/.p1  ORF type:complete len:710 (+),score=75.77 gb/GECG01010606.1/:1-2130(+)
MDSGMKSGAGGAAFLRQRSNSCEARFVGENQDTLPLDVKCTPPREIANGQAYEEGKPLSRSVTEGRTNSRYTLDRRLRRRRSGNGVLSTGSSFLTRRHPPALEAEVEEGNTEYKLQLTDVDAARITHLTTQMKWRLYEGGNEAYYWVGVEDDGTIKGITEDQMQMSMNVIRQIASSLDAEITELRHINVGASLQAKQLLIRCSFRSSGVLPELQIALLGQAGCGKSTLSGVLTNGQLDNGEGLARLFVLRHGHEIEEGHTSSVSPQYLGVSSQGSLVRFGDNDDIGYDLTSEELLQKSSKVITLLDLAGDLRYLKTTILGLMGYLPEYCLLLIDADLGLTATFKQYLGVALSLKLRVVILINKVDKVDTATVKRLDEQLDSLLGSADMSITTISSESESLQATKLSKQSEDVVPSFHISCVSGEGLSLLRRFLCSVRQIRDNDAFAARQTIVRLSEAFHVEDVGVVLVGTVFSGKVHVGDYVKIGPDGLGEFRVIKIRSIHVLRVPVDSVLAGHAATFAVDPPRDVLPDKFLRGVRRGMVLVEYSSSVKGCLSAELNVLVLKHVKPLSLQQRPMLYSGNVRQLVKILHCSSVSLSTGDRDTIQIRFEHHPEFILVGMPVLLVQGHSHFLAVGTVTDTHTVSGSSAVLPGKYHTASARPKMRSYSEHNKELALARASPVLSPAKPVDAEASSVRHALSSLSLVDEAESPH